MDAHRAAGELIELPDKTGFFVKGGVERPATIEEKAEAASETQQERPEAQGAEKPFEAMKESLRAGVQIITAPQ